MLVLRSILVAVICAFATGWCCQVISFSMTLEMSQGGLLSWIAGIIAGICFYREISGYGDDKTFDAETEIPTAAEMVIVCSIVGIVIGWIVVLIFVITGWEYMAEISSAAHELGNQSNIFVSLPCTGIMTWSGAFSADGAAFIMGFVFLGIHGMCAAFLAGLAPIGISYLILKHYDAE